MQVLVTNLLQKYFNTLKAHFSVSFQQKTARTASRFQQVLHKLLVVAIKPERIVAPHLSSLLLIWCGNVSCGLLCGLTVRDYYVVNQQVEHVGAVVVTERKPNGLSFV